MTDKTNTLLDDLEHGDPKQLLDRIQRVLSGETTLQREIGLTEAELEAMYGVAFTIYQSGKHREALRVFSLLASMNPFDFRFIFGTASCYQMLDEFMLAALLHQLAGSLEPQNPSPMIHTAECLTALKDRVGAQVALEEAVKRADSNILYEPLKLRAEVMLANMKAQ